MRGVPDPTASLAAELGVLALRRASARWTDPANDRPLGDLARQSLQELRAASVALGLRSVGDALAEPGQRQRVPVVDPGVGRVE